MKVKDEFGGWVPLDGRRLPEYYNSAKYKLLKTNSGRAAIWAALIQSKPNRVFVPHFICEYIYDLIEKLGISVIKYYIDEQFYPLNIRPAENDCVIVVNYFGCTEYQVKNIVRFYSGTNIILDYSHAFFSPPEPNTYTVYSTRKFFGVPDGGYLIDNTTNAKQFVELQKDFSHSRMIHLLKPIELSTDSAYMDSKENEKYLANNYKSMSDLTEYLLGNIDYSYVLNKRKSNYLYIHNRFKHHNQLQLPDEAASYLYPLLTRYDITETKEYFVKNGYYASTFWKQNLESRYAGTFEQKMVLQGLLIPMDQRYDEENLSRLVSLIRKGIGRDFLE